MQSSRWFRRGALELLAAVCGLVGAAQAAEPEDVLFRDLMRVQAEEPRLRINSGGHIGVVHALAFTPDSSRLCSAGTDKAVEVWNLSVFTRDLQAVFLRERTIRWQVARGPSGHVYALASDPAPADPKEPPLGPGGLRGHGVSSARSCSSTRKTAASFGSSKGTARRSPRWRSPPMATGWSPADLTGQTILWKRGQWKPDTVYESDEQTYGKEAAQAHRGSGRREAPRGDRRQGPADHAALRGPGGGRQPPVAAPGRQISPTAATIAISSPSTAAR